MGPTNVLFQKYASYLVFLSPSQSSLSLIYLCPPVSEHIHYLRTSIPVAHRKGWPNIFHRLRQILVKAKWLFQLGKVDPMRFETLWEKVNIDHSVTLSS